MSRSAKAQRHVYFREPTEFAGPDMLVTDALRDDVAALCLSGIPLFPSGAPMDCTVLAFQWLTDMQRLNPGERFSYANYADPLRLEHDVHPDMQEHFDRFVKQGAGGFLLRPQHWVEFLAAQFDELVLDGARRLFLLTSMAKQDAQAGHAWGFAIRAKTSPAGGPPTFVLALYDPNRTATHTRLTETEMDPRALALHRLLPLDRYFRFTAPEQRFLWAIPFDDSFRTPDPAYPRTVDMEFASPVVLDHAYFDALLSANVPAAVVAQALQSVPSTDIALVLGTHGESPLLMGAAEIGYAEFVRGVVPVLMNSELPLKSKLEILQSGGDGDTPLYEALSTSIMVDETGYVEIIAILMDTFLDPRLPREIRMDLLSTREAGNGQSLFHAPFENDDDEEADRSPARLRAFLMPLLACDLPDLDKATLLMLPNDKGDLPLMWADEGGNVATAAAFAELIAGSALPLGLKIELLASGGAPYDHTFDPSTLEAMRKAVSAAAPSDNERDRMLNALASSPR